jgi:hypothetical protein
VHEVLGSTDSEEIAGVLKEVRRLSSEGAAIDQEMERLIEEYEASDEEVGYRIQRPEWRTTWLKITAGW